MKRYFTFLLIVFACITTNAEKVSELVAFQKAQQFMQGKQFVSSPSKSRLRGAMAKDSISHGYYVFNTMGNNGFVIIASDDRMPEVLGYSEHGSLDPATAPCNVKWLLDYYDKVAANIMEFGVKERASRRSSKPDVRPLILTTWDQGAPYNSQCPELNGSKCITGCVATAMAQVINYNRWPQGQTSGVSEYVTESFGINMPALEPTQFNWDNMNSDDIARLMLYCGQSLRMNYGLNESGAIPNNEPTVLRKVFGYDPMVRYVEHLLYNDEDWEDLIYHELAEQRPVIFNGFDMGSGHTFIVHGYKEGKFYINWGWSGNEDGYFMLTGLNTSIGNYNSDQTATIGIQPPVNSEIARPSVAVTYMNMSSERYVARQESGDFPQIWVGGNLISEKTSKQTINVGIGLYDDNGLKTVLWEGNKEFTPDEEIWFGDGYFVIDKSIANGTYQIKFICQSDESDKWLTVANSSSYYTEVIVSDQWLKVLVFPLSYDDRYMTDLGVQTIEGITYNLYVRRGVAQANVLKSEKGSYKGDLYVPDNVSYEGEEYKVLNASNDAFQSCSELTSLSIGISNAPDIWGCDKLTKLELREGIQSVGQIGSCPLLESIEYPKSTSLINNGIAWCENLKSIRFKNTNAFCFGNVPEWDNNSLPKLSDIYFASPDAPTIKWKYSEMKVHSSATIHVPKGCKADYEASDWKGWKIVEDQSIPEVEGIEWGYCEGNSVVDYGLSSNYGKNDAEYAIHVPAEALAPYKGMIIKQIQYYQSWNSYDYVFITKPGTDYLVKEQATSVQGSWNRVTLTEPYTITGDELYVGIGRHGSIDIVWSDPEAVVNDAFWSRIMGADTSANMMPGTWIDMGAQGFNHPIPIRFVIAGDNIPNDVAIKEIDVFYDGRNLTSLRDRGSMGNEKQYLIEGVIQNCSKEDLKSVTINWDVDGKWSGSKTIEMNLRPAHTTSFNFGLDADITGRDHQLNYYVSDVNGTQDAVASNSSGTISFKSPASTQFPRKIVMEEGTGTWCGWCVRGIETIERLSKHYPDNFIAIGLHTDDEMQNPENYKEIVNQFTSFPGCIINRISSMDPDYPNIIPLIDAMKDFADAKISASATYSTRDSAAVTISTETIFGYSDAGTDYRIAYVVVEDRVGPYVQNNYYSGMSLDADDYMYEWSQKSGKVKIEFNDVARGIYGGVNGVQGSVPSSVTEGETYHSAFSFNLPKNIQNKENIRIIALLIDNKSGEIVNADQSSVVYDDNIDKFTYGFLYNRESLPDNAIVSIDAEEDNWGEGMLCETNPSADPKNGLVLSTFDNSQKTGKAKLEIISNSLDSKQIQWCMGGECVPMNDKNVLEKTFTTDKDGIALVQFDATGIQSKGSLDAVLTTTIDNESHTVKIRFVYSDLVQEPSNMSYLGTQLLTNKKYTSSDFSDIKSGSFKISKDGNTLEFNDLDLNCSMTEGCLFQLDKDATIKLSGVNKVFTQAHVVINMLGNLTITGSGSLTTKTTWYDFWVHGSDLTIDNTTLICEGGIAVGNNMMPSGDNIVVKNATFKGQQLFRLSSLVLINSDFVSTRKIIFDPEEIGGNQLKYEDGTSVAQFDIAPVEGDYANRVTPVAFGDLYLEKNKSRTVNISVQNNGSSPVTKVSYVIEVDGVAETEKTYNLTEIVNRIGAVFDLPITIIGDSKASIRNVKLTITKVNDSENSSPDKTASGRFVTVSSVSSHRVVVEEFTGAWCGWCTRGIVGLNMLNNTFGEQVITVAAHASDPMSVNDYNFIFNLTNYYPSCVINRGELMDPYYGTSGSTPFGIEHDILQALSAPVVGSIDVQAGWIDDNKTRIKMTTKTTFGVDDSSSQFQIGFLLLADGLKGSGSDWAQNNIYSGMYTGDANLKSIENKPAMITDMEYDHVAIAAWGANKGISGSVSTPIKADVPQEFTYERSISDNPLVQDKEKLYVVALLLDKNTGKIINAAKCKVGEEGPDPTPGPNPQEGKIFEFRYENKGLGNNEIVEIMAEKDSWGFDEMNCETNPSANPKNGLILASKEGKKLSGSATINILSNTLNPQMIQWCMGGECVPMNGKSTLTKDFSTDDEGICLVMFDATNIKNEGALEARLTATIDSETRTVYIKFVYDKTNGISVIYTDDENAEWYDMNGARLENAPTRKGVYIKNGKKVIR